MLLNSFGILGPDGEHTVFCFVYQPLEMSLHDLKNAGSGGSL